MIVAKKLPALAFVHPDDVYDAFCHPYTPAILADLSDCFEDTHIGRRRGNRRRSVRFSPVIWSHDHSVDWSDYLMLSLENLPEVSN